jgi:hypothetical protein
MMPAQRRGAAQYRRTTTSGGPVFAEQTGFHCLLCYLLSLRSSPCTPLVLTAVEASSDNGVNTAFI